MNIIKRTAILVNMELSLVAVWAFIYQIILGIIF